MSTSTKVFLDTNVLVYATDFADLRKHKKAIKLVGSILKGGNGVISTQVMKEFYSVATRKVKVPPIEAKRLTKELLVFEVVSVTPELVEAAIDVTLTASISIWDAMLIVAASSTNCATLLTEDLQHGSTIAGVKIENPFR